MQIIKRIFWALLLIGAASFASAQGITTGTVQGTVTDPSGAVVPTSHIQLLSASSGLALTVHAEADGDFKFFSVPVGVYSLTISAPGFTQETVNNVNVQAGATTNLNQLALRIGTAQQIEVNGSTADLLETSDAQVTTTFDAHAIQNLPLNNGFDTIAEVIPGVAGTGGRYYGDDFSNANGDNFSVNGQNGRYNNFEIDGQANNDNSLGGPSAYFGNQDAIQEIQIVTNDFGAQYGRNAGAIVNYVTKFGSNNLHGSAFEFYQSQFLSSLPNYQKSPIFGYCAPGQDPSTGCSEPFLPRFVENRFGATLGGPIVKNKLFFFAGTYWDRLRQGAAPAESLPNVSPDPTGIAQLQAAFPSNPGVTALASFGPYSVKAGSPQAIGVPSYICAAIGTANANGTCSEIVTGPGNKSVPVEVAGVERSIPSLYNDQEDLGRIDWQPSAKDHLFARYLYQPILSTGVAGSYTGSVAAGDFVDVPSNNYSVGADWTHIFSASLLDQLRYSFQEGKSYFQGGARPNCVATNFGRCPAVMNFIGTNADLDFGGDLLYPQGRTIKVTQVQNNATWTHGKQTVFFGGEFDNQNSPNQLLYFYNGELNFGTLSNLLQNGPGGFTSAYGALANGNPTIPFTEPDTALYVQDDWKALPTLTLHLGLRWEFFSQALNKLHDETVARESNAATALWPTTLPLSARTTPLANQYYTNFEPRIGLAWNPDFDKKLVVKAGYAINANPAYYSMFVLAATGAPTVNTGSFACNGVNCLPSNGSLLSGDVRAANLSSLSTYDPREADQTTFPATFRTPYVQTWTLAFDHQFGGAAVAEARYVGSKTTSDFQSTDANPYLLPVALAFPKVVSPAALCSDSTAAGYGRLHCANANVSQITNGGWAKYNALQLNLTTRNFHGLTSSLSYTWSKNIDNATDGYRSTGSGGSTIAYAQNPLNTSAAERGLSGNDLPQVVGAQFSYNVPSLVREGNPLSRLANGFALSGVYRFTSGLVYTPFQPLDLDPNTGDTSYCDTTFNGSTVGPQNDTCRLVLSNKKAPVNTVAYLNPYTGPQDPVTGLPTAGNPQFVAYGSDGYDAFGNYSPGTPINPQSTHWIIDNQAYANAVGNPYPGSGRSLLRGPNLSQLDATIVKTTRINEHIALQLSLAAYNVLNQMYLGPGQPNVASSVFTSNIFNYSGTNIPGSASGNRFMILGARIVF